MFSFASPESSRSRALRYLTWFASQGTFNVCVHMSAEGVAVIPVNRDEVAVDVQDTGLRMASAVSRAPADAGDVHAILTR